LIEAPFCQAFCRQDFRGNFVAISKASSNAETLTTVTFLAKLFIIKATLGNPHRKWGLAPFKTQATGRTRTATITIVTTAGSLAMPRTWSATNAFAFFYFSLYHDGHHQ